MSMDDMIENFAKKVANSDSGENGGSAYPFVAQGPDALFAHPGMTLRDYFAGQVLAAQAASYGWNEEGRRELAENCYKIADVMLEARKR